MGKTKDIRVAVEAELRVDPKVDAAGITVNNIGGNVANTPPAWCASRRSGSGRV